MNQPQSIQKPENVAALEIFEGRYFSRIWYTTNERDTDWLGTLYRDRGGPWIFQFRFRHYKDAEVFNSKDVKNWYRSTPTPGTPEEEILPSVMKAVEQARLLLQGKELHTLVLETDDPLKVVAALQSTDWAHMQLEKDS